MYNIFALGHSQSQLCARELFFKMTRIFHMVSVLAYKSTFPSWNNTSAQVSVSSLVSMKYLIAWNRLTSHCNFCLVDKTHQPFYWTIFACSRHPAHPLEQSNWG
jgi:hypothetical protein